jgi:hypothetical protein
MNKQARRHIADFDDDDPDAPFDSRGILKDGHRVRVPTTMRDAASVGRHALSDAERTALRGCQPGFRYAADTDTMRERRQWAADAYTSHEFELVNSWRNPPLGLGRRAEGNGRFGTQGVEGDVCTVRDGGVNEGAPGHLRRVGGVMRCIADDEDDDSAFDDGAFNDAQMDAEQYRELVYQEYARSISRAWRRG